MDTKEHDQGEPSKERLNTDAGLMPDTPKTAEEMVNKAFPLLGSSPVYGRLIALVESAMAAGKAEGVYLAQDELVKRDCFTERTLRILDGLADTGIEKPHEQ